MANLTENYSCKLTAVFNTSTRDDADGYLDDLTDWCSSHSAIISSSVKANGSGVQTEAVLDIEISSFGEMVSLNNLVKIELKKLPIDSSYDFDIRKRGKVIG